MNELIYVIIGLLVGFLIPQAKLYSRLCAYFIKCMRRRSRKIAALMVENNKLRKLL